MAKSRTRYCCQNCGKTQSKWLGRCPECGEWNTLVEELVVAGRAEASSRAQSATPVRIGELDKARQPRLASGLSELDRVLGGGRTAMK